MIALIIDCTHATSRSSPHNYYAVMTAGQKVKNVCFGSSSITLFIHADPVNCSWFPRGCVPGNNFTRRTIYIAIYKIYKF